MKKIRLRKRHSKTTLNSTSKKGKRGKKRTKSDWNAIVRAMRGTGGHIRTIAKRIGLTQTALYEALKKAPDWVLEELRIERQIVLDIAEETVLEMTMQRLHFPTAAKMATWVLQHHPDAEKKGYKNPQLTLEGGKNPLKIQNEELISLDKLKSIPLDIRKQMLEEMEKEEEKKE